MKQMNRIVDTQAHKHGDECYFHDHKGHPNKDHRAEEPDHRNGETDKRQDNIGGFSKTDKEDQTNGYKDEGNNHVVSFHRDISDLVFDDSRPCGPHGYLTALLIFLLKFLNKESADLRCFVQGKRTVNFHHH